MAKFNVGEIAIYRPRGKFQGKAGDGAECQIMEIEDPSKLSAFELIIYRDFGITGTVYYCEFPGDPNPNRADGWWAVEEPSLEKRPGKHQDADLKAAEPLFIQSTLPRWLHQEEKKHESSKA